MARIFSIPLFFFLVAGLIGLLLRWYMIHPFPGLVYGNVLHAHSHLMFLGWVGNAIMLAFLWRLVPSERRPRFMPIFWTLQVLLVGMMISFPLQGYGVYSIVLSTLHTIGVFVFAGMFFRTIKNLKNASCWLASVALIFFIVSAAGPFSLGYLMANGMGKTQWYYFSVYYYLHFQYNGFFTIAVLGLFFRLLEERDVNFDTQKAIRIGKWIAFSSIPAYTLSVLWAEPGPVFNIIGFLSAAGQLYAFFLLLGMLRHCGRELTKVLRNPLWLFNILVLAFLLKLLLQLASAHPYVAQLAYEIRPVVIAYLHLVLAGVVSLFLLMWYVEMDLVNARKGRAWVLVFLVSLAGTEIVLVFQPWWSSVFGERVGAPQVWVFFFSAVMVAGLLGFLSAFGTRGRVSDTARHTS